MNCGAVVVTCWATASCPGERRPPARTQIETQHYIGGKHRQQRVEVSRACRGEEGVDQPVLQRHVGIGLGSGLYPAAGSSGHLAGRRRGAIHDCGDLIEWHGEDVVQDERESLRWSETFEHDQQR